MIFLLNLKIQLKRNSHLNFTKKKGNVYGVIFIRGMFKRVASASKNTYNLYKDFTNENPLTSTFVIDHAGKFLGIADHLGFVAGAEILWRKELKKKVMPILQETIPPYVEQFQDILFSETLLSPLPLATLALTALAVYSVGEDLNENYITSQDGLVDIKLTKNYLPLFHDTPYGDFKQTVKELKVLQSIVKK